MDYSKLKGKIKEVFGTQQAFARELGISTVSLSMKLNNLVSFTQAEMNKSRELLGIPFSSIAEYFSRPKVKQP